MTPEPWCLLGTVKIFQTHAKATKKVKTLLDIKILSIHPKGGFFDLEDLQHDSMTNSFWKQPLSNKNHSMLDFQGLFPFRNRGFFMATRLTHFHIVNQNFTLNNNRWQDSTFVLMKIMNSQPQKLPENKAKSTTHQWWPPNPPVGSHRVTPPVDSRNSWTAAWSSAALRRRLTCSPWGRKSQRCRGWRIWWEGFGGGEVWGRGMFVFFFLVGGVVLCGPYSVVKSLISTCVWCI